MAHGLRILITPSETAFILADRWGETFKNEVKSEIA